MQLENAAPYRALKVYRLSKGHSQTERTGQVSGETQLERKEQNNPQTAVYTGSPMYLW